MSLTQAEELFGYAAEVRMQAQQSVRKSRSLRFELNARKLAIQQVFLATHGRRMTVAERRLLVRIDD
jgi:hypothetical protein